MVLVIVAIALVTILASILMSISLVNYKMKITELKAKDTFYSAEVALDQVHAGLQNVISEAMDVAYMQAVQQYKYPGITEEQRIQNFRNSFSTEVRKDIKRPDTDAYYLIGGPYDASRDSVNAADYARDPVTGLYTKGLVKYLDKTLAAALESGRLVIKSRIENAGGADNYLAKVEYTMDGMVLQDIIVGYMNDEGFYSEIQTDILIGFPSISLKESTVLPNVFSYATIANEGLVFDRVQGATITSSMYAGDILLENCPSTISFDNVEYLVTGGNLTVNQSPLHISSENFWAKGVDVIGNDIRGIGQSSSQLYLEGASYIEDDLTLQKNNITATLSGEYYGYSGMASGNTDMVERKSAILLNCANTTLDLNALETLMLCGNAYINARNVTMEQGGALLGSAQPVMLGSSVSTKVDQIAFLAPVECLGTINGQSILGRNPMTEEEYNLWSTYNGVGYERINVNVETNVTGKKLSAYGFNGAGDNVRTIFRQIGTETVVYVYLNFTSEDRASAYYRDYVSGAGDLFNNYMARYENTISYDGAENEYTRGNVITYLPPVENGGIGGDVFSVTSNSINNSMGQDELNALIDAQTEYESSYRALCAKLTTNYNGLMDSEKNKSVYENIVNLSVLESMPYNVSYYTKWAGDTYRSLAVNNVQMVDGVPVSVPVVVGSDATGDYAKCVLVIATGDVEIKGNFSGLIIAGGEVRVSQSTNVTISSNEMVVESLLKSTKVDESLPWGGKTVIETYFKDGNRYVATGDNNSSAYISLDNVIAYLNWTKQ